MREERLAKFWPDADALLYAHWRELCIDPERLKMDLDKARYSQLEQLGMLYVLTARRAGRLVGYLFAFIMPHFHYKTSGPMAATDMYFVDPAERRGVGLKLFTRFERDMRARGVVQMITSCKIHQNHTRFLELLEWRHTDNTLCKFL